MTFPLLCFWVFFFSELKEPTLFWQKTKCIFFCTTSWLTSQNLQSPPVSFSDVLLSFGLSYLLRALTASLPHITEIKHCLFCFIHSNYSFPLLSVANFPSFPCALDFVCSDSLTGDKMPGQGSSSLLRLLVSFCFCFLLSFFFLSHVSLGFPLRPYISQDSPQRWNQ